MLTPVEPGSSHGSDASYPQAAPVQAPGLSHDVSPLAPFAPLATHGMGNDAEGSGGDWKRA